MQRKKLQRTVAAMTLAAFLALFAYVLYAIVETVERGDFNPDGTPIDHTTRKFLR